jgi:integrase
LSSIINRKGTYHLQWFDGGKPKRRSLRTKSKRLAVELQRQFDSKRAQGIENPLPTRTPIGEVVAAYAQYIRVRKTAKSAQTDLCYLRRMFGPCCPEVEDTRRRLDVDPSNRRRGRRQKLKVHPISAPCFEQVTTALVSDWLAATVRAEGWAPKTANRYREVIHRVYSWAIKTGRVRMPADANPVTRVERYAEPAPEIRYLTLPQIDEQLAALADHPQLQTMVAVYIYAGLRREEALWLTVDDVDLDAGMIRVRAKTTAEDAWQPKTKKNRVVPISASLRPWLTGWTPPATKGRWCFPSPKGTRFDPDNFSASLRRVQRPHRLPWTCLDFRHTFGSHLAQRGVSLYKIAALMGNSPDICRRHYAALSPELMRDDAQFQPPLR